MGYRLNFSDRAKKGIKNIEKSGDRGKIRQMRKAFNLVGNDPRHASLRSHRMRPDARFGKRDDLWISYIRTGPGGERIVWAYGEKDNEIQVLDIEYVGPHVDK